MKYERSEEYRNSTFLVGIINLQLYYVCRDAVKNKIKEYENSYREPANKGLWEFILVLLITNKKHPRVKRKSNFFKPNFLFKFFVLYCIRNIISCFKVVYGFDFSKCQCQTKSMDSSDFLGSIDWMNNACFFFKYSKVPLVSLWGDFPHDIRTFQ